MTSLIACLTTGKGTWTQVIKLMQAHDWDKIFLVTNSFGKEKFSAPKEAELILIDEKKPITETVEYIRKSLQGKIAGFEVAVNLTSGTGYEHMATMSAVLKLGLAMRLVGVDEKGVIEI